MDDDVTNDRIDKLEAELWDDNVEAFDENDQDEYDQEESYSDD